MDAWTQLDAAVALTPEAERERWRALAAGARARANGALEPLQALTPAARLQALAYLAARAQPPTSAQQAIVTETLAALAWPWPSPGLALALWAGGAEGARRGLTLPGHPDGSALVASLQIAIGWGLEARVAIDYASLQLGAEDIGTDTVRIAALEVLAPSVATAGDAEAMDRLAAQAHAIAKAIAFPSLRLHGLFILALADLAPDPLAAETARIEVALDELWTGVADAELALLTGREEPLDLAVAVLDKPTTIETRHRLWRVLFRASTRFGVQRWRPLVERLREDKALMRDGALRGALLWEATTSAHLLATPEARADGLGALAEGARRLPDAGLRALVYAEMARLLATVPGRSPSIWLDEAKKVLAQRVGGSEAHLAQTLRTLSGLDSTLTTRIVEALTRPGERVIGWAILAEAEAGRA